MATSAIETERKYDGPPVRPELLADLSGVAEVIGSDRQSLRATYYDTADMRLARHGITLRRREGGQDEGWHAKLPINAHQRREIHVPLDRAVEGTVPTELADLVSAYLTDRPLRRCAHIATERTVWRLVDRAGEVLAEIADDTVHAQELGDHEGPVRTWHEVEIELDHGDATLLAALGARLTRAGATPSTADSKLSRALGDLPQATRSDTLRGTSSAADVVTTYLRAQMVRLRAADVSVRLSEPEGVHDLRVAIRRIRSVLRVCRPILIAGRVQLLTSELKWISDLLGTARDAEVLRTALDDALTIPPELVLGPVRAQVERYLAKPAAAAEKALRQAMNAPRYRDLLDRLDALLTDPPWRHPAGRRARKVLPPLVARAYRKTTRAATSARRMAPGPERDTALHLVRRRAKRLRYAVEMVEPVLGKPARRLRRRTKDLQSLLGDHHDLVVLRPVLRELGAQAYRDRANGFTFGLVHGRADERARRLAHRFPHHWHRMTKRRATRWLAG